jgi:hypothetical protein
MFTALATSSAPLPALHFHSGKTARHLINSISQSLVWSPLSSLPVAHRDLLHVCHAAVACAVPPRRSSHGPRPPQPSAKQQQALARKPEDGCWMNTVCWRIVAYGWLGACSVPLPQTCSLDRLGLFCGLAGCLMDAAASM